VKKYADYRDFVNGDGPAMSTSTMNDIEKHAVELGYSFEGMTSKPDYLEVHFYELNFSDPVSRLAVLVCFLFGFSILTSLSGRVCYNVVLLLWRNPFGN
jgi:hypothetical protein